MAVCSYGLSFDGTISRSSGGALGQDIQVDHWEKCWGEEPRGKEEGKHFPCASDSSQALHVCFAASQYLKEAGVALVFHCREEEAEAQRGKVTCPRSYSLEDSTGIWVQVFLIPKPQAI